MLLSFSLVVFVCDFTPGPWGMTWNDHEQTWTINSKLTIVVFITHVCWWSPRVFCCCQSGFAMQLVVISGILVEYIPTKIRIVTRKCSTVHSHICLLPWLLPPLFGSRQEVHRDPGCCFQYVLAGYAGNFLSSLYLFMGCSCSVGAFFGGSLLLWTKHIDLPTTFGLLPLELLVNPPYCLWLYPRDCCTPRFYLYVVCSNNYRWQFMLQETKRAMWYAMQPYWQYWQYTSCYIMFFWGNCMNYTHCFSKCTLLTMVAYRIIPMIIYPVLPWLLLATKPWVGYGSFHSQQ